MAGHPYNRAGATAQPVIQRLIGQNANFANPLSFSAFARGDPFRFYGKALRFLKLVFQAADGEDLVILSSQFLTDPLV